MHLSVLSGGAMRRALTPTGLLDRAVASGVHTDVGQALSQVLGVSAFASTDQNVLMQRANNLATLVVQSLVKFQPAKRREALEAVAGIGWTQSVLGLAAQVPGIGSVTEATRFALAMHFLVGIVERESKRSSMYADGYLAFATMFKHAERRVRAYEAGEARLNGVHTQVAGLGQTRPVATPTTITPASSSVTYQTAASVPMSAQINAPTSLSTTDLLAAMEALVANVPWKGYAAAVLRDGRISAGLRAAFAARGLKGSQPVTNYLAAQTQAARDAAERLAKAVLAQKAANEAAAAKAAADKLAAQQAAAAKAVPAAPAPTGNPLVDAWNSVTTAVAGAAVAAGKAVETTAANAGKALDQGGKFVTDAIVAGLTAVFGAQVGGFIAKILTTYIDLMKNFLRSGIEIVSAVATGLLEFVQLFVQGKFIEAVKALLTKVTSIIFILPPIGPVLATFLGIPFDELKRLGTRVAEKNPLFILAVVLGILGVLTPTPATISVLILALSPAIAVLVAPGVASLLKMAVEKVEDGIERLIKILLVVFQGFLAVKDIVPKIQGQVTAYLDKKGGLGNAVASTAKSIVDRFSQNVERVLAAFSRLKLSDAAAAVSSLLTIVPEIIGALFEEADAAVPSIRDVITGIKGAQANVEAQEKELKAAQEQLLMALTLDQRRALVIEQASKLSPGPAGEATAAIVKRLKAGTPAEQKAFIDALKVGLTTT